MKKNIKILSIFLFIATFFFSFMLINNIESKVRALDTSDFETNCSGQSSSPIKCLSASSMIPQEDDKVTEYKQGSINNGATLNTRGKFTLKYQYGYTEILIYVEKCTGIDSGGYKCKDFKPDSIIHFSGTKTKDNTTVYSKEISLDNYYNDGDIIRVSIIYELATTYDDNFFYPQFCNVVSKINNCTTDRVNNDGYALLPNARVEGYTSSKNTVEGFVDKAHISASQIKIDYDSKKLIYKGLETEKIEGKSNTKLKFANIVVRIEDTHDDTEIESIVYGTVIPALLAVLGVCAVVTSTVLGYKIVKSADDPGERQEKIKSLRNILIGLAAAALVLLAARPVQSFVEKLISKQ